MKQLMLTPSAGKRLIGKGIAALPEIEAVLKKGTLVIIAGTTNACVAEEILDITGERDKFSRARFFRGITLGPSQSTTETGRISDESGFPGDVVITDGVWQQGKTIDDVADILKEGDIILKGANALDLDSGQVAVLVGNPQGGTIIHALKAYIGRRVRLIIPVGLEKRVSGSLDGLAEKVNAPGEKGLRLFPAPGEIFTEIEALSVLTGVEAELFAAGGVSGAEGCVWLLANGTPEEEAEAEKLVKSIADEPAFIL